MSRSTNSICMVELHTLPLSSIKYVYRAFVEGRPTFRGYFCFDANAGFLGVVLNFNMYLCTVGSEAGFCTSFDQSGSPSGNSLYGQCFADVTGYISSTQPNKSMFLLDVAPTSSTKASYFEVSNQTAFEDLLNGETLAYGAYAIWISDSATPKQFFNSNQQAPASCPVDVMHLRAVKDVSGTVTYANTSFAKFSTSTLIMAPPWVPPSDGATGVAGATAAALGGGAFAGLLLFFAAL